MVQSPGGLDKRPEATKRQVIPESRGFSRTCAGLPLAQWKTIRCQFLSLRRIGDAMFTE